MNAVANIWNNLDWSVLTDIIIRIVPALLCITLHELSHGYVAYLLGDTTARDAGRLTLNPIRHLDPMGLVMMVSFGFGWAKPVPVNMYRFRNPKRGMALTALAGPGANLVIGVVLIFLRGILFDPIYVEGAKNFYWVLQLVGTTAWMSLAMMIFNLLPISPLDGSKVAYSFLPDRAYEILMRYERYGMIALFVLSWSGVLGSPISTATVWVYNNLSVVFDGGRRLYRVLAGL